METIVVVVIATALIFDCTNGFHDTAGTYMGGRRIIRQALVLFSHVRGGWPRRWLKTRENDVPVDFPDVPLR